jgi:hypothetical protein
MAGRIVRRLEPEIGAGVKLPLLGRIKVGMKAISQKTGKEFPTSIDWFRADGKYAELFHQVYGEKPNRIQIVFPSNRVEDVCSETYICRDDKGRLLAEGDGETWRAWSTNRKEYVFGKSTIEEVEKKYGKASVSLTIRFLLPKIPSVFGIWQFTTKGAKSSIPAIRDTFDQVLEMAGVVSNIPFDLTVEKVKSNKPGEASVFPVVTLIPNVSQENLDLLAGYVQAGQKLRGVMTEARIKALLATGEEQPEAPMHPALPAAEAPQAAPESEVIDAEEIPPREREPGEDDDDETPAEPADDKTGDLGLR